MEKIIISKNKSISISIKIAKNKKSNVTLIIGPGYHHSMNENLLEYLSDKLIEEKVNVVRFDYPFKNPKFKMIFGLNSFVDIYEKVFEYIRNKDEFKNDYFFIGGKSLSSAVASRINSDKIKGYLFLCFPQKVTFLKIPISNKSLFRLKKPMFFIKGTNDEYSDNRKMELLVGALNPYARLMLIPDTNHSLKLLSTEKRKQSELNKEIADIILWFISDVINNDKKIN
ncbi:MAG: alpha/beta family hydrolase [Candidatus Marinimicrobia bacterium]|nr:alpha/beta family hydrolase [Candidatus Neomarinimicrobiota bacterium]